MVRLFLIGLLSIASHLHAAEVLVAAASSMKYVLDDMIGSYRQIKPDVTIKVSYGASGQFYSQILQGAPYDIFLSADVEQVDKLLLERPELPARLYARGRLVLARLKSTGKTAYATDPLIQLQQEVALGAVKRLAIASWEHAPYGKAAKQALSNAGIWEKLQGRLVVGENVSQAASFAFSGSTAGGLVSLATVLSPPLRELVEYARILQNYHEPILQKMVLLRLKNSEARGFYEYFQTAEATRIIEQFGFETDL